MSSGAPTVEDRLKNVEEQLSEMKQAVTRLEQKLLVQPADPNWLEQISGSMKDLEGFDEVVRLGREFRKSVGTDGEPGP